MPELFPSERLRQAIRDAILAEAGVFSTVEVCARAAESWWMSMSLRTQPDFIQALIEADTFDWENATPDTMESLKARLEEIRARRPKDTLSVTLREIPVNAATDALLAMESFAGRMYTNRANDPGEQEAYNALGLIALPLRAARDDAMMPAPPGMSVGVSDD